MPNVIKIGGRENSDGAANNDTHGSPRILVAEDDDDLRRMTVALLSDAGYVVDEVENGLQAWQAMEHCTYDLLLTDNNMPEITGIELLARLYSSQIKTPAILVTGEIPTDELRRRPSLQIDAMILKPYTAAGLLAMVENILNDSDLGVPETSQFNRRASESTPNPSRPDQSTTAN